MATYPCSWCVKGEVKLEPSVRARRNRVYCDRDCYLKKRCPSCGITFTDLINDEACRICSFCGCWPLRLKVYHQGVRKKPARCMVSTCPNIDQRIPRSVSVLVPTLSPVEATTG